MAYWISSRIRKFREAANLTQTELSHRIGVSSARYSNWEQGLHRPDVEFIAKICKALNVSPSEMLDIRLSEDDLNDTERKVIRQYRKRPKVQEAIHILLGMEPNDDDG